MTEKLKIFAIELACNYEKVEYAVIHIKAKTEKQAFRIYKKDEGKYWSDAEWEDSGKGGEILVDDVYEKDVHEVVEIKKKKKKRGKKN